MAKKYKFEVWNIAEEICKNFLTSTDYRGTILAESQRRLAK